MNHARQVPTIHIRFDGRSFDIPLSDLDLGMASSDQQIKQSLAAYLDINESRLTHYVVDRHSTGNLTIRPQAVFG